MAPVSITCVVSFQLTAANDTLKGKLQIRIYIQEFGKIGS